MLGGGPRPVEMRQADGQVDGVGADLHDLHDRAFRPGEQGAGGGGLIVARDDQSGRAL
jgi:hypothetical protein